MRININNAEKEGDMETKRNLSEIAGKSEIPNFLPSRQIVTPLVN